MSVVYAKTEGVTLVGGGHVSADMLNRALNMAPWLVAADGGADKILALGQQPDLAIGDFDSISPETRAILGAARLHQVAAQHNTDFDKALDAIEAPFVLALGFSGGRLDHTLAAMNTLLCNPNRRVIVETGADLCVVLPPELVLTLPPGTRVSLFPMGATRCRSEGLEWPTDALAFSPFGRIGTSNQAVGGQVTLRPETPRMLLLVPPTALDALLKALRDAPLWQDDARAR
ncbi:thiamine diphosphokinase [Pararhodobacter sp.]|uniref:thiamine diphosphokinase n=1 Tax=Pararhodobacter sp. TaxID=2127056 RepID=UPI002AFE2060|nr:thiamine diphosphokinase [Pararhodobacter sp.]